jgi:arginase
MESDYLPAFARETVQFRDKMASVLRVSPEHRPTSIAVGGDHSVSLAHVAALLRTVAPPAKTGIIMFDSHADINLVKTSPTGNVHGMWLRPIIDQFDHAEIDQIVTAKISPQHLVYVGNQNLDTAERMYIEEQGIKVFSAKYLRENKPFAVEWLTNWMKNLHHIHLSVDVDGFDKSLTPATGIPCLDGLLAADVAEVIALVKQSPQWSADLVEVNPQKAGAAQTIQFAQDFLRTLLTEQW